MTREFRRTVRAGLYLLAFNLVAAVGSAPPAAAQQNGLAAKRPIVAAACIDCPWGTVANVLKIALQPYGYELQICYTCERSNNPRIVTGEVKMPPTDPENSPPPPAGAAVDFGISSG